MLLLSLRSSCSAQLSFAPRPISPPVPWQLVVVLDGKEGVLTPVHANVVHIGVGKELEHGLR